MATQTITQLYSSNPDTNITGDELVLVEESGQTKVLKIGNSADGASGTTLVNFLKDYLLINNISFGSIQTTGKIETTNTGADSIKTAGGIDWAGGNVIYVPIGASIQDAINGAKTGDTIILGSGTYTITSTIIVNKKLHIMVLN